MQTERQAIEANAREWAASLTTDEISRLLLNGRQRLKPYEAKALANEENKRRQHLFIHRGNYDIEQDCKVHSEPFNHNLTR